MKLFLQKVNISSYIIPIYAMFTNILNSVFYDMGIYVTAPGVLPKKGSAPGVMTLIGTHLQNMFHMLYNLK